MINVEQNYTKHKVAGSASKQERQSYLFPRSILKRLLKLTFSHKTFQF